MFLLLLPSNIHTSTQPIALWRDQKNLCEHLRLLREQTQSVRDHGIAFGHPHWDLQQLFQRVQESGERIQQEKADCKRREQEDANQRPYNSELGVYNFQSFTRDIMRRFKLNGSFAIYFFFMLVCG